MSESIAGVNGVTCYISITLLHFDRDFWNHKMFFIERGDIITLQCPLIISRNSVNSFQSGALVCWFFDKAVWKSVLVWLSDGFIRRKLAFVRLWSSGLLFRSEDPSAQTKSNWKWAVGTLIRRSSSPVLAVLNTNETRSVGSRTNGSFKLWPGFMVYGLMLARSFAFFLSFSKLSLDPGILWLENPAGYASPVGPQRLDRTKSQGVH